MKILVKLLLASLLLCSSVAFASGETSGTIQTFFNDHINAHTQNTLVVTYVYLSLDGRDRTPQMTTSCHPDQVAFIPPKKGYMTMVVYASVYGKYINKGNGVYENNLGNIFGQLQRADFEFSLDDQNDKIIVCVR
jgi:hypothetical protein